MSEWSFSSWLRLAHYSSLQQRFESFNRFASFKRSKPDSVPSPDLVRGLFQTFQSFNSPGAMGSSVAGSV